MGVGDGAQDSARAGTARTGEDVHRRTRGGGASATTVGGAVEARPCQTPLPAPWGRPPDMTPREAADRLFNRVISASERGDTAEAQRFAPMAVAAYARVSDLDADAHFHLGLLNLVLAPNGK